MEAPGQDAGTEVTPAGAPRGELRVNGLAVVVVLVLLGMGAGSAYYIWKAPPLIKEMRALQESVPASGEPRLERWMEFGAAMIANRLTYLRLSKQQPWLVTHVVSSASDEPPAVWGIEFDSLGPEIVERNGLEVVIALPAARELCRCELVGDNAARVPRFDPADAIPDPDRRAEQLVEWALRNPDDFIARFEREHEGATLRVRVGDE